MTSDQSKQIDSRRRGPKGGRGSTAPKSNGGGGKGNGNGNGASAEADDVDGGIETNRRNGDAGSNRNRRPGRGSPGRGAAGRGAPGRATPGRGGRNPLKGQEARPSSGRSANKGRGGPAAGARTDGGRNPNRGGRGQGNGERRENAANGRNGDHRSNDHRHENRSNKQRNGNDDNQPAKQRNGNNGNKSRTKKVQYEPHQTHSSCLRRYADNDPTVVRGKLRVMPSRNGTSFVTCDRGSLTKDVLVGDEKERNRALDGDYVFVELYPPVPGEDGGEARRDGDEKKHGGEDATIADFMTGLKLKDGKDGTRGNQTSEAPAEKEEEGVEVEYEEDEYLIDGEEVDARGEVGIESEADSIRSEEVEMWHDDDVQMSLWDPKVNLRKRSKKPTAAADRANDPSRPQRSGRVVCVLPPKSTAGQLPSELDPEDEGRNRNRQQIPKRTIVGTLTRLPSQGDRDGRYMLVPNNRSLPRFMCPPKTKADEGNGDDDNNADSATKTLYRAEYAHGSWRASDRWPPCTGVTRLCGTCNVHDETRALLVENGVDHGEFPPAVLKDVEKSVKSGRFFDEGEMGWRPTEEMLRGRRDYRDHRVFTIDPTTAKDLDDALHITPLPDGRVEIGVHIADVSHFIQPNSFVDKEALKRATTVYLVNDVVPMLPRPLCEIACSLNENVERLAFSCVWRMNMDGTLGKKGGKGKKPHKDDIWYGRTVIRSCARLDYATAQNIIDRKVANGEGRADEAYWPKTRQPAGGHTIDEVAADVRLMHKVAMARRKLRFENGALALNGVKLAFQLEEDGETPRLCAPYPIRDSNRLIEEFMLLANYLVAQRLITHANGRALLRNHMPPIEQGMQQVVDVSKESFNFDIDTTDSKTLQESLSRLSRECDDELVVQCVTESLVTPMRPAEYIAAGELDETDWQHFALNIPYYTHFTSPIRRYPDVIVHRLLQATLDGDVGEFPSNQKEIHAAADHCNDMRMSAKKAQERSDRVFLSLYLRENPISLVLGVCLGVGEKTFTVFVPSLGLSTRVFLQEHEDEFDMNAFEDDGGKRRIVVRPRTNAVPGMEAAAAGCPEERRWKSLDIKIFTKLEVACTCKMQPPIDVRVKVVGPWIE